MIRVLRRQRTPFGQRCGAVVLECVAAVEMTVLIEMIVDRYMNASKFLQRLDVP